MAAFAARTIFCFIFFVFTLFFGAFLRTPNGFLFLVLVDFLGPPWTIVQSRECLGYTPSRSFISFACCFTPSDDNSVQAYNFHQGHDSRFFTGTQGGLTLPKS